MYFSVSKPPTKEQSTFKSVTESARDVTTRTVFFLFLPRLANAHHEALRVYMASDRNKAVLEDYLSLGYTPNDLVDMNDSHFCEIFYQTFSPMVQIAMNMGFESWNYTFNYE